MTNEEKLQKYLQIKERNELVFFSKDNFINYSSVAKNEVDETLKIACKKDVIRHLYKEYFYNPHSRAMSAYVRDDLVHVLRPLEFTYISFEFMLYKYGIIGDAILALTVATTGKDEICWTEEGAIIFRHLDIENVPLLERHLLFDANRRSYIATPRIALRDMEMRGLPLPEIDEDEIEFIESNIPGIYDPPPLPDYSIYR